MLLGRMTRSVKIDVFCVMICVFVGSGCRSAPPEPTHQPKVTSQVVPLSDEVPPEKRDSDLDENAINFDCPSGDLRSVEATTKALQAGGAGYQARQELIKRCADCHPKEYESWRGGPHSKSRVSLLDFYVRTFAPDSPNSPKEREDFHKNDPAVSCCVCHCPTKNIYESQIPMGWDGQKIGELKALCVAIDEEIVTDGVDCLTCHARGDHVVTRGSYRPTGALDGLKNGCKPTPSAVFSHINTCAGCHQQASYTAEYEAGGGKIYPFVHCDECHRKRDASGAYLHSYQTHKERREGLAKAAFDRIAYDVEQKGASRVLRIRWKQDFSPHAVLQASVGVYVLKLDIVDKRGGLVQSKDYRFFARDELTEPGDMELLHEYNPGADLVWFKVGDVFDREVPLLESYGEGLRCNISVYEKAKFDFKDDDLILFLNKSIVLDSASEGNRAQPSKTSSNPAPRTTTRMVEVSEGKFFRGCDESRDSVCLANEKPGHLEFLPAFAIDEHEVTVGEYENCCRVGVCTKPVACAKAASAAFIPEDRRNLPVTCIDWHQASSYCAWVGKRLPSEAEWEKACRGIGGQKYPWGEATYAEAGEVANVPDESALKAFPNWDFTAPGYDDGFVGVAPVGSFPEGKSPYGALDMIGNVWEFVSDAYDDGAAPEGERAGGTPNPDHRAIRGGSWRYYAWISRCSDRSSVPFTVISDDLGFRCARTQ
jgi:formylglycine-generating enzyme required for sulfatase activity